LFLGDLKEEQVTPYYRACDVFALASVARADDFGAVQIKAMSAGKPVVNTQVDSGVPSVSLHRVTGITVRPSDSDAMADAINELLDKPELRETYGQASRVRASEQFSAEVMGARTLSLYDRVMSMPSGCTLTSQHFTADMPLQVAEVGAL
jgi:rhamnosyl/mannosyltransferase